MQSLRLAVQLVKLPVVDLQRARVFYRDVLGLEEEFAVEDYGWAQYRAGAIPLCLYVVGQGGGDGLPGSEAHFHLSVDDAAAAFAILKSRGAGFACELTPSGDGGLFFIVQDPEGNRIKVIQPQTLPM